MKQNQPPSEIGEAIREQKGLFKQALFFSVFTNLLAMSPTLYMLEVYDRVVNSRSEMTLAMLTLMIIAAYALMEFLEWVRAQILHNAGRALDAKLSERVFNAIFEANLKRIPGGNNQLLVDLRTIREFLSSSVLTALMDVPLSMLYIVVVFAINPVLGYISVIGALVQAAIAYLTEKATQPFLTAATRASISSQLSANESLHNARVIEAMGMLPAIHNRWLDKQYQLLVMQARASDAAGQYSALAKVVQLLQSSAVLGMSCWLSLKGLFPGGGGMMIVASVLGARVLQPLTQVISLWKHIVGARDARARLDAVLHNVPLKPPSMSLPPPKGLLTVESVVAGAPGSMTAIIRGISFGVAPGQVVAIIGPSGSGKSTLARLLVGVWPASNGKVRLDGVDIFPWDKAELGPHLGYLPQDVELFEGTIAENIARFGPIDMGKIEAAARAVGVHEAIVALPQGYDSNVGEDGSVLSGGQRQRVGLARAVYGNPRFLVLDEPNSSLDEAGEASLLQTLLALKAQGATIILITHRPTVFPAVDKLLLLVEGQAKAYGPRDEVLAALQANAKAVAKQQAEPKNVAAAAPA